MSELDPGELYGKPLSAKPKADDYKSPPPTSFGHGSGKIPWKSIAGFAVFILIGGWAVVYGGRWLAGYMATMLPYSVDQTIGEVAADAYAGDAEECTNPALLAAVGDIVQNLQGAADSEFHPFHVKVLNDDQVNAFALPGGYIFVLTGILDEIESPEELIGVLGHEVGHVVHRHGIRRIAESLWFQFLLSQIIGDAGAFGDLMAGRALDMLQLKFGRDQESESDVYGLDLMLKAGYDPKTFPQFFGRLPDAGVPEWFSTHPNSEGRAGDLDTLIAELGPPSSPIAPPTLQALKLPCHAADPGAEAPLP